MVAPKAPLKAVSGGLDHIIISLTAPTRRALLYLFNAIHLCFDAFIGV